MTCALTLGILLGCLSVDAADDTPAERASHHRAQPLSKGDPLVVHVVVALCDNKHQGIVPVPAALGNGQDPGNNLYWGALYGVKTYLPRKAGWQELATQAPFTNQVLASTVFHRQLEHDTHKTDVYIVAEAWDGRHIRGATHRFLNLCAGESPREITVTSSAGTQSTIRTGGAAGLIVYVGHNGLMDFDLDTAPGKAPGGPTRSVAILACKSKPYFEKTLNDMGVHKLLLTTHLMAPEAYTLDAIVRSWAQGRSPEQTRQAAAAAYHRYQKCGMKAATRLFHCE